MSNLANRSCTYLTERKSQRIIASQFAQYGCGPKNGTTDITSASLNTIAKLGKSVVMTQKDSGRFVANIGCCCETAATCPAVPASISENSAVVAVVNNNGE